MTILISCLESWSKVGVCWARCHPASKCSWQICSRSLLPGLGEGDEPLFSRLKEVENGIVKGWDFSSSGFLTPHKALRAEPRQQGAPQAEPGRREPAAGLSCPGGESSRDIPGWTLAAKGGSSAGDNTAMSSATQPRAQPLAQLPLPCLPDLVILNMLWAAFCSAHDSSAQRYSQLFHEHFA